MYDRKYNSHCIAYYIYKSHYITYYTKIYESTALSIQITLHCILYMSGHNIPFLMYAFLLGVTAPVLVTAECPCMGLRSWLTRFCYHPAPPCGSWGFYPKKSFDPKAHFPTQPPPTYFDSLPTSTVEINSKPIDFVSISIYLYTLKTVSSPGVLLVGYRQESKRFSRPSD